MIIKTPAPVAVPVPRPWWRQLYVQVVAAIVLGAAVYAFRTLEWRTCEDPDAAVVEAAGDLPAGEAEHRG